MVAAGTTPPLLSFTTPRIVPVGNCAKLIEATARTHNTAKTNPPTMDFMPHLLRIATNLDPDYWEPSTKPSISIALIDKTIFGRMIR
jgi:hypothetical protein